ncbi:M42 family metallopeptidase [Hutsoniella sourekii]|uniref:M42 family metallopeptidase n=1 Tax=Hutsoniella sourekii TaxID=87650 RepID=UPI0004AF328A
MQVDKDLLIKLTEAKGIAGDEGQVRQVFQEVTGDFADDYVQDNLGSIFAVAKGQAEDQPKILMGAHLDEVGFMVQRITEGGFLHFVNIGGWWSQVVLAQEVEVTTRQGKVYHGVTGSKPPHVLSPEARKKPVEFEDVFVDIGASSKEEVLEWGIRPGDMITPYIRTRRLNDSKFLLAKAWDNRIGVAVAVEALKYAHSKKHDNNLYLGANVQEEVGLRGAKTAAFHIDPDIAIALDTGTAGDTPGMTAKEADSELGKGPQVIIYDASAISHRGLRHFITDLAEKHDIPFQYTLIPGGGTDTGSYHLTRSGIPSIAITIPVRYLHSHTSVIHEDDYLNTIRLVQAIIDELDSEALKQIKADI